MSENRRGDFFTHTVDMTFEKCATFRLKFCYISETKTKTLHVCVKTETLDLAVSNSRWGGQ